MTKSFKLSLMLIFIYQLFIASGFELAHDEAYYWLYSKHLDWGYFDHPPFVAIIIKLFSFLPHSELAVRFGFVILQFASLLILMTLSSVPLITMLLFFSFPLASASGLFALPDLPLLFMTSVYCWMLKRYLKNDNPQNSISLGIVIAGLLYAKYHGILLIFFTILALPRVCLKKSFYLVALVALVSFFPHILWQYHHEFSTLKYHFLERPSSSFSLMRIFEYLTLQTFLAGLFVGPLVWYSVIKEKSDDSFKRVLKFISLGVIAFFLISSFSKKTEANWTIFLTIPLILLSEQSGLWNKKIPRILLYISFAIILLARCALLFSPTQLNIKRLGEFHGWKSWSEEVKKSCQELPLMANSYQIASKLSFYLNSEIHALNYRSRKNQFDYWRFDQSQPTNQVCYITDKNEFSGEKLITPDGKNVLIVKNLGLDWLWGLKSKLR
jgi:hypothetical protein